VSTRPDAEATGPRSHVLGIITAFRELGWDVHPFISGDRVPRRVATGSRRLLTCGPAFTLAADLARLAVGRVNARRAWLELGGRVDLVYERFAAFQALGARFHRQGVPWVLETQGPFYDEAKFDRASLVLSGLARRLELRAYRQCDVLVCVSHALRNLLIREGGLPADKAIVVPNGVDPSLFAPGAHAPKRTFEGFTIAYTGSLTRWQSLDLLLHAMKELEAGGVFLHLAVIGDGAMREAWEGLAVDLGVSARVRFLGRLPHREVPALIAGSEVGFAGHARGRHGVVYHSPLKIYEYLAMAKPVVASASDDALAVLREGENGFVYEPEDLAGLVGALRHAWTMAPQLSRMGERAREAVVARHTWRHRAEQIRERVRQVLGEQS
jgi:glycosyltransferase involved in cell wall biosynthesis